MKKLRQIVENIKSLDEGKTAELQAALWQLICYSPKMPNRLQQQQLLDEAETISLKVQDPHFAKAELTFNAFKWGNGKIKVLLTHGWSSKAADFIELIQTLRSDRDFEIWSFDAPGNGSSEGELSNLLLYAESVKQIWSKLPELQVMIGHSLGGMANALAIQQQQQSPELLISIAPLINLKANFIASMDGVNTSLQAKDQFFQDFEALFNLKTDHFVMNRLYNPSAGFKHLLIYEETDHISPKAYIEDFLAENPDILTEVYGDTSHARILNDPRVISTARAFINQHLGQNN